MEQMPTQRNGAAAERPQVQARRAELDAPSADRNLADRMSPAMR